MSGFEIRDNSWPRATTPVAVLMQASATGQSPLMNFTRIRLPATKLRENRFLDFGCPFGVMMWRAVPPDAF